MDLVLAQSSFCCHSLVSHVSHFMSSTSHSFEPVFYSRATQSHPSFVLQRLRWVQKYSYTFYSLTHLYLVMFTLGTYKCIKFHATKTELCSLQLQCICFCTCEYFQFTNSITNQNSYISSNTCPHTLWILQETALWNRYFYTFVFSTSAWVLIQAQKRFCQL